MGYVVEIATLAPMTHEQAQAHSNENPHTIDGVEFTLTLAFSEAGLAGTRYAMLDTGDMPLVDPRFYKLDLGPVDVSDGVYSAAWVQSPCDLPIETIAESKLNDMRAECEAAIEAGFYSSALGAPHRYSSDRDSQTNMQWNLFAATNGESVPHICYDAEGVRAERLHTAEQMVQVSRDFGNHIWPKLRHYNDLRAAISSEQNKADLVAISWT